MLYVSYPLQHLPSSGDEVGGGETRARERGGGSHVEVDTWKCVCGKERLGEIELRDERGENQECSVCG